MKNLNTMTSEEKKALFGKYNPNGYLQRRKLLQGTHKDIFSILALRGFFYE